MIPMAKDVLALVGESAEKVENRSLLYEKFVFPKEWGHPERMSDYGRWNVLRIVTRGSDLLQQDAARLRKQSEGRNVQPHNKSSMQLKAAFAERLSHVAKLDQALLEVAGRNTVALLEQVRNAYGDRAATFTCILGGRMLLNMAGGVVETAGSSLDRLFGLPYIPGSAVKGITRNQALWSIHEAAPDKKHGLLKAAMLLFGFTGQDWGPRGDFAWAASQKMAEAVAGELNARDLRGCASFLPAYPAGVPKLVVDMVNPHYKDYYGGKRPEAMDDEAPIPNYFPAVEKGASFGFAFVITRLPDNAGVTSKALLDQARAWLEGALQEKGAGAKTAAGYGWFRPVGAAAPAAATDSTAAAKTALPGSACDALLAQYKGMLTTTDNFRVVIPELRKLASDADLRRAFEALVPETERRSLKKGRLYWQSFTSGKHGDDGKAILKRLELELK